MPIVRDARIQLQAWTQRTGRPANADQDIASNPETINTAANATSDFRPRPLLAALAAVRRGAVSRAVRLRSIVFCSAGRFCMRQMQQRECNTGLRRVRIFAGRELLKAVICYRLGALNRTLTTALVRAFEDARS